MASQHDHIHTTVSITKKVSVQSSSSSSSNPNSSNNNILELSNLDRQCPILIYLVFFYKPSDEYRDLSIETLFDRLKSRLKETLSDWYPAAGRLIVDSENGKVNILCNNGGAILVEAVTEAKIYELGDLSNYNQFYEKLVFKVEDINYGNISEMPLVVAQVTKFSCGGYSLGIGMSHSLFDGPGACHFLCAWASKFSTKPESNNYRLYAPVHERGRLLINDSLNNHRKMSNNDDDIGVQSSDQSALRGGVAAIDHLYQMIKEAISSNSVDHDQDRRGGYVISTFRFSAAMIEGLKKKVYGGGDGDGESFPCSSFEVLAAHLWKVRTKALQLNQEKMVCLQFAVDVRNKITSPLPKGFSGNAYVLASIASTTKDLEQESYKTLIKKINEAKKSINDDYVNEYIKLLEGPQVNLPSLDELTIISDWTNTTRKRVYTDAF